MLPELVAEYKRTRGRQKAPTKARVTVRLDEGVVEHYKGGGTGWQSRMNDDLKVLATIESRVGAQQLTEEVIDLIEGALEERKGERRMDQSGRTSTGRSKSC